jgi:hypothetical protein
MGSPLRPLPNSFAATVATLHRVAEELVAPARKPDNEIALEATPGGFGTPEFEFEGASHRVRVEGGELVHEVGGERRRGPLTSLAAAAVVIADLLPSGLELDDGPLAIDPAAARVLAEWYGLGARVLGRLVADAAAADAATAPRLWPEHFDIAIELGSEADDARANYGLSPGDEDHPQPYAYVGPWATAVSGDLWQASGFSGAELSYADLIAAADPEREATEFFTSRRDDLSNAQPSEETS